MQEATTFKPLYVLTHAPIEAYFSKNSDDFVVREIPLYEFSGDGEHLIVEISKKDKSVNSNIEQHVIKWWIWLIKLLNTKT